jgi:hypothetical protein
MAYAVVREAARLGGEGEVGDRADDARGHGGALLAAALVAIQAASVAQGRNARMYALGVLLAGATGWLLLRARRGAPDEKRWWIGYGVAVAAFCATHYYAVFIVAAQAVFVLAGARAGWGAPFARRRFLAALAQAAVLFGPWLPVMIRQAEQVRENYWIPGATLASLGVSLVQWAAGAEVGIAAPLAWLFVLALACVLGWGWRRGGPGARFLLLTALLPWAFALGLSALGGRPIVLERYMAFGQLFLICAWGVLWSRVPRAPARAGVAAALVAVSAAGLGVTWRERYPDRPTALWYAARYLKRQAAPGDLVITRSPRALNKLRYYAERVEAPGLDIRYAAAPSAADDHFSHLPSLQEADILRADPFADRTPRTLWRLEDVRTAPEPPPPGWEMTNAKIFEGGDAPTVLVAGYAPVRSP